MADTISTADLVTDPVAGVDPAARLDPAKVRPVPAKPKRKRRTRSKSAAAKLTAAKTAAVDKRETRELTAFANNDYRGVSSAEGRAAYQSAKAHQMASSAELPETGALVLRFAAHGEFVEGEREVNRADLSADGDGKRVTYTKLIEFDPGVPPATITEAWLIADTGEAVSCDLGVGLPTGGGHQAQLPARHLLF